MLRIDVVVTTTSRDVKGEVIAASVDARPDMHLVEHRCVAVSEVESLLSSIPPSAPCALILVGRPGDASEFARQWLARRANLVVMHVDLVDDVVRVALRDPRLESLLSALVGLVERVSDRDFERFARIRFVPSEDAVSRRPLLRACVDWVEALLRAAVARASDDVGDLHGLTVSARALLATLDVPSGRESDAKHLETVATDETLIHHLADADPNVEPLAAAARTFELEAIDFRLMVAALAPELDLRYQRCIGFLLDDMGRRTGTMTLWQSLLGASRGDLDTSAFERWLLFDGSATRPPAGDEPLRLDPFLAQWLLGQEDALARDPLVRRAMRLPPWAGAALLERNEDRESAAALMRQLTGGNTSQWIVLGGEHPADWHALLELGASIVHAPLIRIEPPLLAGADVLTIEECARRIGRLVRLTSDPLVVDMTAGGDRVLPDDQLSLFLATLGSTGCRVAVICRDQAPTVRLLQPMSYELPEVPPLSVSGRVAAVRAAATGAEAYLSEEAAAAMARRYPLRLDGLEQAMHLARSRPKRYDTDDPALDRFQAACKDVASDGLSHLAERIELAFDLDDVVLPSDQHRQLVEIVDNIHFAPLVLDEWKFREQMPYGRGVTALFFGPSGAGKTMAAIGIARRLGVQLLRLELSRVISKYVGETEKNIDAFFNDGHRSGSAILIDEADGLLARRATEISNANDRHSNVQVAYLLQRMEAYEGLAILTTNMRQNLDAAFLRRLRFIVDFPRPDATARERIWRQCLPQVAHVLDDAAFRQLARRIDLTGGHIRQITVRAAFIAAAAGEQIRLEHIARAARAEFAKLGMPPVELDLSADRRAA